MSSGVVSRVRGRAMTAMASIALEVCCVLAVGAQVVPQSTDGSPVATRSELETLAASLQQRSHANGLGQASRDSLNGCAEAIERRLHDGDFLSGDRIVLHVIGEPALNDTLTVRANQLLPLPGLEDLALQGVLRSELRERMGAHLSRFLRAPQFTVTSLIRLAVVGEVAKPGFYAIPADARVTDAVMLAGGPTSNGDPNRLKVSRAGRQLMAELEMRDVVARGLSLDVAGLAPGDEIVVGQRGHNSQIYFQAGTVLLSAISTFAAWAAISRRH